MFYLVCPPVESRPSRAGRTPTKDAESSGIRGTSETTTENTQKTVAVDLAMDSNADTSSDSEDDVFYEARNTDTESLSNLMLSTESG